MTHIKQISFPVGGLLLSAGLLLTTSHKAEPGQEAGPKPAQVRQMVDAFKRQVSSSSAQTSGSTR